MQPFLFRFSISTLATQVQRLCYYFDLDLVFRWLLPDFSNISLSDVCPRFPYNGDTPTFIICIYIFRFCISTLPTQRTKFDRLGILEWDTIIRPGVLPILLILIPTACEQSLVIPFLTHSLVSYFLKPSVHPVTSTHAIHTHVRIRRGVFRVLEQIQSQQKYLRNSFTRLVTCSSAWYRDLKKKTHFLFLKKRTQGKILTQTKKEQAFVLNATSSGPWRKIRKGARINILDDSRLIGSMGFLNEMFLFCLRIWKDPRANAHTSYSRRHYYADRHFPWGKSPTEGQYDYSVNFIPRPDSHTADCTPVFNLHSFHCRFYPTSLSKSGRSLY